MKVRLALVEHMPDIIRESVKPMERIDGIKIFQVDGLGGNGNGNGNGAPSASGGNLADQIVNSALRYRAQAPLLDTLLGELGLDPSTVGGLTQSLTATADGDAKAASVEDGANTDEEDPA